MERTKKGDRLEDCDIVVRGRQTRLAACLPVIRAKEAAIVKIDSGASRRVCAVTTTGALFVSRSEIRCFKRFMGCANGKRGESSTERGVAARS